MLNTSHRLARVTFALVAGGFVCGCSSSRHEPYSLTGSSSSSSSDSRTNQERWTDERGLYHPDWRQGINRPPNYPKDLASK
jgi:hypothetical protein